MLRKKVDSTRAAERCEGREWRVGGAEDEYFGVVICLERTRKFSHL